MSLTALKDRIKWGHMMAAAAGLTESVALQSIGHLLVHRWNTEVNSQAWTGGVRQALLLPAELWATESSGRVGSHYLWMCTHQAPVGSSMLMVTQNTPG